MKTCRSCGEIKSLNEYHKSSHNLDGHRNDCKSCNIASTRIWQNANINKRREANRRWGKKNREKTREYVRKWALTHHEEAKENTRLRMREWRKNNIEKSRENARIATKKRLSTPKGKLSANISRGILHSLKSNTKSNQHWEILVGYTIDQLKKHIEKQFNNNMTWDNYGTVWEIDHKIPIAVHNFEKPGDIDFRLCWSLKNLQPLEKTHNRSKHSKINNSFQPSLSISI